MDQKTQFVSEYLRDSISFAELCERYQISRKTGYKWINRLSPRFPKIAMMHLSEAVVLTLRAKRTEAARK